ncbi:MAG: CHAT domain-containing protein [Sphingobacteriales bacterium]|nr:MAG: CHAT domain-containing protein [Sphingobacteriales bacterium]
MKRLLLSCILLASLAASAQTWDTVRTSIDTLATAGGSYSVSGWSFSTAEEYDESDFIQAKADQFYVSLDGKRPDSLAEVRWRFVQQHLKPGDIYIDFLFTEFNDKETFLASVIRPDGIPVVQAIPKLQAGRGSGATQAALRGVDAGNATVAGSYLSYKNLLAYLEPELAGVKTIYYSSANDLNLVNLKFLKGKDGKFLFEKYNLVRLHSAASFLGNRQQLRFPKKMNVLLVGNVAYECDGAGGEDEKYIPYWDALPGSKVEIRNIAALLKGAHQVDVLDSCKATEARFVEQVGKTNYDILHLATHGFYFPATGNERYGLTAAAYPLLFTGIVLAGANHKDASVDFGNDRGMFTTMDFKRLNVSHMRLVVLSTCFSGTGISEHSSAPLGLTLALLRQGIQAMVLSNRAIPDKETTEFMTTFYRNLAKSLDADAAFNSTLRELHASRPNVDWSFMDLVH